MWPSETQVICDIIHSEEVWGAGRMTRLWYSSSISRKLLLLNWLQFGAYQNFKRVSFKTNVKLKRDFNPKDHFYINSLRNVKWFFFLRNRKDIVSETLVFFSKNFYKNILCLDEGKTNVSQGCPNFWHPGATLEEEFLGPHIKNIATCNHKKIS